ncbi:unnamed protein product, partial [Brenthis ino]
MYGADPEIPANAASLKLKENKYLAEENDLASPPSKRFINEAQGRAFLPNLSEINPMRGNEASKPALCIQLKCFSNGSQGQTTVIIIFISMLLQP